MDAYYNSILDSVIQSWSTNCSRSDTKMARDPCTVRVLEQRRRYRIFEVGSEVAVSQKLRDSSVARLQQWRQEKNRS
jgi:hypothetical protein